jgi:hypothetical protein
MTGLFKGHAGLASASIKLVSTAKPSPPTSPASFPILPLLAQLGQLDAGSEGQLSTRGSG